MSTDSFSHTTAISKAAKNRYVSPSAISIAINSLEKELGYPVFVRSAKGLIPIQMGKLAIEYAGRIGENRHLMSGIGVITRHPLRTIHRLVQEFSPAPCR